MNTFKNTRFIIPALVLVMGIFNLLNPNTTGNMRTFWWFLTPFALLVGLARLYMFYKQKKSEAIGNDHNS
jgi:cytochrome c-type biogenesis protein CcmH/NrfF